MAAVELTCIECGDRKHIDGFPDPHFAQCWDCAWDEHIRTRHPKTAKTIRKTAKRRARRVTETQIADAMTARERRQTLPRH